MSSWSSAGKSQEWFMLKDECLIVNYNDEVIGSDNKYNVHKFVSGQPKGVLHRAFSVMLFDAEGRLLLQQRASSKVTFPGVWTNTCCSHPLHGQTPSEVDGPETVKAGASTEPTGVKHAAVRKLQHELGRAPRGICNLHALALEALVPRREAADLCEDDGRCPFRECRAFRHRRSDFTAYGSSPVAAGKSFGALAQPNLQPSSPHHFATGKFGRLPTAGYMDGTHLLPAHVAVVLHFESAVFQRWRLKFIEYARRDRDARRD